MASLPQFLVSDEDEDNEVYYNSGDGCGCSVHSNERDSLFYPVVVDDHIKYRYQITRTINRGTFGEVVEALDHKTRKQVAIKIISKCERRYDLYNQEKYFLELVNSYFYNKKHYFLQLHDAFIYRQHPCLVFECLESDLYREMLRDRFRGFPMALVRDATHTLLRTLELLAEIRLIHSDIKPDNIVFSNRELNLVKLIDYGACCFGDQKKPSYVQTRIYRAPEILLRLPFSVSVDLWSLICVTVEMVTGMPLFWGSSEEDQLACIIEVLGMPPESLTSCSPVAAQHFFDDGSPKYCISADGYLIPEKSRFRGLPGTMTFEEVLERKCRCPVFIDFIKKCLVWEPEKRLTPKQALRHSFFWEPYRDEPPIDPLVENFYTLTSWPMKLVEIQDAPIDSESDGSSLTCSSIEEQRSSEQISRCETSFINCQRLYGN